MHLSTEEKKEIFKTYGAGEGDTGSPESQIALFSIRIKHLTEHLKNNHKDYTTSARTSTATVRSSPRRSSVSASNREDFNPTEKPAPGRLFFMGIRKRFL